MSQPSYAESIVHVKESYTYEMLTEDLVLLKHTYPEIIQLKSLGRTFYNRPIWTVKLGTGKTAVFLNGAHHAREWLTTTLLMKMIEQYASHFRSGTYFNGYNVREALTKTSIWFVPMVNPDGVTLQQKGFTAFPEEDQLRLLKMNSYKRNFSRWKANGRGIDLNRQYPVNWHDIKINFPFPHWQKHKGYVPFQTKETKALKDLTYSISPELAISYHSAGQVIYWFSNNKLYHLARDLRLASSLSKITGYKLVSPTNALIGGGYTDWFINKFQKPAFTPEITKYVGETNPPVKAFQEVWQRNKMVGLWAAEQGYKLSLQR